MKKKHLSTISVATILGTSFVLGMATSSHADAIAVAPSPTACPTTQLVGQNSAVTDVVTANGTGGFDYAYRVCNLSLSPNVEAQFTDAGPIRGSQFIIRDWEIPIFGDYDNQGNFIPEAGGVNLTSITSPSGWNWNIETIGVVNSATGWDGIAVWQNPSDPWNIIFDNIYGANSNPFDSNTFVLHWYVDPQIQAGCDFLNTAPCIDEGGNLTGFGFTAGLSPVAAPFQTSWIEFPANTGDPSTPAGGGLPQTTSLRQSTPISEPGAIGLLLGGLGLFGTIMRRRKK